MTLIGIKRKLAFFCVNQLWCGTKKSNFEKKRKKLNSIGYQIGEGTKIVGPVFCTGNLTIGKDCWIGRNFNVDGNGTVIIGDNCDIGPCVTFVTGGHIISTSDRRAGEGYNKSVIVGNGCWIAENSTILPGVSIGNGCVVAACACVNKNVEENVLVGGVPAYQIKRLDENEENW